MIRTSGLSKCLRNWPIFLNDRSAKIDCKIRCRVYFDAPKRSNVSSRPVKRNHRLPRQSTKDMNCL